MVSVCLKRLWVRHVLHRVLGTRTLEILTTAQCKDAHGISVVMVLLLFLTPLEEEQSDDDASSILPPYQIQWMSSALYRY